MCNQSDLELTRVKQAHAFAADTGGSFADFYTVPKPLGDIHEWQRTTNSEPGS